MLQIELLFEFILKYNNSIVIFIFNQESKINLLKFPNAIDRINCITRRYLNEFFHFTEVATVDNHSSSCKDSAVHIIDGVYCFNCAQFMLHLYLIESRFLLIICIFEQMPIFITQYCVVYVVLFILINIVDSLEIWNWYNSFNQQCFCFENNEIRLIDSN